MRILERLLEQYVIADVTESRLWTDGVFRALEQDPGNTGDVNDAVAAMTTGLPDELS